jgi:predicted nucleic acid-binding Zn ribbon protein
MERAGRLIGKMKLPRDLSDPETRVRAVWALAAGKKIARHTRATNLVRDSLIVEVEDCIWQKQLATLEHFFIKNLAQALGEKLVTKIDFRPMPRRLAPQRAETARPVSVETVDDPVLDLLYRQSKQRQLA